VTAFVFASSAPACRSNDAPASGPALAADPVAAQKPVVTPTPPPAVAAAPATPDGPPVLQVGTPINGSWDGPGTFAGLIARWQVAPDRLLAIELRLPGKPDEYGEGTIMIVGTFTYDPGASGHAELELLSATDLRVYAANAPHSEDPGSMEAYRFTWDAAAGRVGLADEWFGDDFTAAPAWVQGKTAPASAATPVAPPSAPASISDDAVRISAAFERAVDRPAAASLFEPTREIAVAVKGGPGARTLRGADDFAAWADAALPVAMRLDRCAADCCSFAPVHRDDRSLGQQLREVCFAPRADGGRAVSRLAVRVEN
jgi:hypothetical protein